MGAESADLPRREGPTQVGSGPFRRLTGGLASLLLLLGGGCTEFAHGVVDQPMPNDVRLVGYWEVVNDREHGHMRIAEVSPTSLRIDLIDHKSCKKEQPMSATRTEINGVPYLDVTIPPRDHANPLIFPIDYDFDDQGQLVIGRQRPDEDFERAIVNGELPGRIIKSTSSGADNKTLAGWPDSIHVDASTAELRQFLAARSRPTTKPAVTFRRPLSAILPCEPGSSL